jgi:hypothetical protein
MKLKMGLEIFSEIIESVSSDFYNLQVKYCLNFTIL